MKPNTSASEAPVASPARHDPSTLDRRLPIGAEVLPGGGVHFRVSAPARRSVHLVLEGYTAGDDPQVLPITREPDGHFSVLAPDAKPGMRYRFRVEDNPSLYPDPASRFQPKGVHGPSMVVDPGAYRWRDTDWKGVDLHGQVIYEMHIGTFTPEGTWSAAQEQLKELAELGVTLIEVMPVNEFPGEFGWGYDGVDLFAPTRLYGAPDDFRAFVDEAHQLGVGVILDVVYNHFGPAGNYLQAFNDWFIHPDRGSEWGDSLNFDGEGSAAVREFVLANAAYWIDEFHLDGLRLDATQAIIDESSPHILTELSRQARAAAGNRRIVVIAENEPQDVVHLLPTDEGGYGLDGLWNDDIHHSAVVAVTGQNESYLGDYRGTPQELISAAKWGYLFQGQWNARQKRRRGTPTFGLPGEAFVVFLQNHDQIANSPRSMRIHHLTSPGRLRAATALSLLLPGTPLLFQGQEFAASAPFLYFADHEPDIAKLVKKGRLEFVKEFHRAAALPDENFPDPTDRATFDKCKLDFAERERHAEVYALHRDLLKLRREDPIISAQRADWLHGAVLSDEAFALRYIVPDGDDRLILINFGRDLHFEPAPEPLLAPPRGRRWEMLWCSEDPRYGGAGAPPPESEHAWRLLAHCAVVLKAARD